MVRDNMKKSTPKREMVAQKILDYLTQNPQAMDSPEGIAQWWVASRVDNVNEALKLLVRRKSVQALRIKSGTYYRLYQDHPNVEPKKENKH